MSAPPAKAGAASQRPVLRLRPIGQRKPLPAAPRRSIKPLPPEMRGRSPTSDDFEDKLPWFEPFRLPFSAAARALADAAISSVEAEEERRRLLLPSWQANRKRTRHAGEREMFRALVAALVSDLAYRLIKAGDDQDPGMLVSMSHGTYGEKRTRYDAPFVTAKLGKLVKTMAAPGVGLVEIDLGGWGGSYGPGTATALRAGPRLLSATAGLRMEDYTIAPTQEIVRLRGEKDEYDNARLVDYEDDDHTEQLRATVRIINDWLAAADIEIDPASPARDRYDIRFRRLRRNFTRSSFKSGGRAYGGFWQRMKKAERKAILIGGEETTALDFGQVGIKILYGLVKRQPPAGHAYTLPMLDGQHRDGVKTLMAALQFCRGRPVRWPEEIDKEFPEGTKLSTVLDAIEVHHHGIIPALYKLPGHTVQYHESEIMIDILLRLRDRGIVALPIHDCVVVARSRAAEAKDVMVEAFSDSTGVTIEVKEE